MNPSLWVIPWDNHLSKKTNPTYSFFDRNSLYIDTSKTQENFRFKLKQILKNVSWMQNDISNQKHFSTLSEIEKAISNYFHNSWLIDDCKEDNIEPIIKNLKEILPYIDAKTHFERVWEIDFEIYSLWKIFCPCGSWVSNIEFVHINNQERYIQEMSQFLLNGMFIYRNQLYFHYPNYFYQQLLEYYVKNNRITKEEIKETIWKLLHQDIYFFCQEIVARQPIENKDKKNILPISIDSYNIETKQRLVYGYTHWYISRQDLEKHFIFDNETIDLFIEKYTLDLEKIIFENFLNSKLKCIKI